MLRFAQYDKLKVVLVARRTNVQECDANEVKLEYGCLVHKNYYQEYLS